MVTGIEKFREHFAGHEHQYVLIGGAACDLIFTEAGLPFRATRDLDIVLCVEAVDAAFASAFQGFIESGGYQARQKSDGRKEFYRFHKPANAAYPFMIEVFSRKPEEFELPDDHSIIRVPVDESIISLSAILLDDCYYAALQNSRTVIEGISLLSHELLIPFKAKAVLNLMQRQSDGENVRNVDIKKHRNDVFRLAQLLPADHHIDLVEPITDDLNEFLDSVREDEALDPKSFGVPLSRAEGIALLENVYLSKTADVGLQIPVP